MTRDQIYNHIQERGDEDLDITPDLVYRWWWVLNNALFSGSLPVPDRVEYCKDSNTLGWYHDNSFWGRKYKHIIGLNVVALESRRELFLNVLAHEMVHMHQGVYRPEDCAVHGKYFFSFAPLFEDAGLELTRTYHVD
jgi:hypothetical protein